MEEKKELAVQKVDFTQYALTPAEVRRQVNLIQEVMKGVMKEGEHYGKIPGCGDKPTLLKPGAEKLSSTFSFAPEYKIERHDYENGHREYEVTCRLYHIPTGKFVAEGVGCCSTLEAKYRYRWEDTGKKPPKEYWENRDQSLIGKNCIVKKVGKEWHIFQKVEHDNPADYYNTVKKMAKKRAHVDAVLTATAASDIFTQDIEELVENEVISAADDVIDVEPEPQEPQEKPITQAQKRKLFAMMSDRGLSKEEAKEFYHWFGATTKEQASDLIEHFDDYLALWQKDQEEEKEKESDQAEQQEIEI